MGDAPDIARPIIKKRTDPSKENIRMLTQAKILPCPILMFSTSIPMINYKTVWIVIICNLLANWPIKKWAEDIGVACKRLNTPWDL